MDAEAKKQERLERFAQVDLYPVTCETLSAGRSDLEVLEGIIAGGARIVQLRDKEAQKGVLYRKALTFRQLTSAHNVLLIINDHADIALAVEADGVHLGQADLPLPAARNLLPNKIIGISTHSLEQALEAEQGGADYVNIGPIFPTGTKPGASQFLGPQAISDIGPHLSIPFTVMGGINRANLAEVMAAGTRQVAVVTAITQAQDIAGAVRELQQIISGAGQGEPTTT